METVVREGHLEPIALLVAHQCREHDLVLDHETSHFVMLPMPDVTGGSRADS